MNLPGKRTNNISDFWQISILTLCFLLIATSMRGKESFCFRVYLKDKGESSFKLSSPEDFLSPESVERRMIWETFVDLA